MTFHLRKLFTVKETTLTEGGRKVGVPVTMAAVAAVIANPWHGRGFVEDLSPEQREGCAALGKLLSEQVVAELGAQSIEAYGKSAVVGLSGEIEHACAVIHNIRFGNEFRAAVDARSYLAFTNKRGAGGCSIQVPMKHLHDAAARSHFLTLEFSIPDAPNSDEIVVVLGASTGGRPHARIGDRRKDEIEMGLA